MSYHIYVICILTSINTGFICSSVGKESACNAGDPGSIPELGRSPEGGHGNPLQFLARRIPGTEGPGGLQSVGGTESAMTEVTRHAHTLPLILVVPSVVTRLSSEMPPCLL